MSKPSHPESGSSPNSRKQAVAANFAATAAAHVGQTPSEESQEPPITNDVKPIISTQKQEQQPGRHDKRPVHRIAIYPFGLTISDLHRYELLTLTALLIFWFLWSIQAILPPFLIAFSLAALLDPILRAAERKGRKRWMAICTLYMATLLIIILLGMVAGRFARPQLEDVTQNFDKYYSNIQARSDEFLLKHADLLHRVGIQQERLSDLFRDPRSPVKRGMSVLLEGFTAFLQDSASKALWVIIIPVATFFLMLDYPRLRARIIAFFPEEHQDRIDKISGRIVEVFSEYLRGLAKVCTVFAIWSFAFLYVLGVKNSLFLGILAGVFYAVPYAGQIVTAAVLGSVAYSMPEHIVLFVIPIAANSLPYALIAVGAQITSNNIFDQIFYPKIVGASVGLNPVVSILAITSGATLFGLWGMLLAMPVAASIQIVLINLFPQLTAPAPERLVPPESR